MKLNIEHANISNDKILEYASDMSSYTKNLQTRVQDGGFDSLEASINCADDEKTIELVESLVKKFDHDKLKYIFVIGIGGSNLGTMAVYNGLFAAYDKVFCPRRFPKIIFIDTNNVEILSYFKHFVSESINSSDDFVINIVTKSGGTTETLANAEYIIQNLKQSFDDVNNRIVITTDFESKLWNRASELGLHTLPIPKNVGGRYSVLSAVGLFPLRLATVDTEALLKGAKNIRSLCTSDDIEKNIALQSAICLYENLKNGKTINDNFIFDTELESLGKWYRQLMGESIGKEFDKNKKQVFTGITPTVSLGSTDLHSVAQLYLGGPRDKFTTFITTNKDKDNDKTVIGSDRLFPDLIPDITGKSMSSIMTSILQGVQIAYQKNDLPFMELRMENISPFSLGEFLQFKMIEMMYLGQLMNVNPFDQPNVESYKVETKELLSAK